MEVTMPGIDEAPQLPQEVLKSMLDRIPQISLDAKDLITPVSEARDQLRDALMQRKWIEPIPDDVPALDSVAAVDGGQVVESMYAGDLVAALAVAAEGLHPANLTASARVHSSWTRFLVHNYDLDRLSKCAMVAQELSLLGGLDHDMVIFDGSHQTPVIVLNSALASGDAEVRRLAVEVCDEFDVESGLQQLCFRDNIIACPKSDSSRDLSQYYERNLGREFPNGLHLPASDKVLAALVLEPGEMLNAAQVPNSWSELHIISAKDPVASQMAKKLDAVISPLRDRDIAVYYAKPYEASTAVKVEFKKRLGSERRVQTARMISIETPGPHLQEPFCQFLADLWAKSVSLAVAAQIQGVRLDIAEHASPAHLEYLLRSYRTFGG
jgi:hypothetical protein